MSNLNLAIEVLEKELERQNLLIMADRMEKHREKFYGDKYKGPPVHEIYPNMLQLRDQLEDAIALLKNNSNEQEKHGGM